MLTQSDRADKSYPHAKLSRDIQDVEIHKTTHCGKRLEVESITIIKKSNKLGRAVFRGLSIAVLIIIPHLTELLLLLSQTGKSTNTPINENSNPPIVPTARLNQKTSF